MLHSAACKVKIESEPPAGYFTNGDLVSGYVQVEVKRELRVASIEAFLACEDRGRTYLHDNEDVVDIHSHFDHCETIWSSEPFTFQLPREDGLLAKGEYRFNFEFRLPEKTKNLPSSYNIEPRYDFNGIFWGVHATIDRDARARSNYSEFAEIHMLPQRKRALPAEKETFLSKTHDMNLKLHSRPSFLISDSTKNIINVEGRLEVQSYGIVQTPKEHTQSEPLNQQIRISIRTKDQEQIVLKEIVLFMDTIITTTVHENEGTSRAVAIVIDRECNEIIEASNQWHDVSHLISDARIYGLPETWKTNLHDIKLQARVQLTVAPLARPNRTSILEVAMPVTVHSEVSVVSARSDSPPPPYRPAHTEPASVLS